MVDNNAVTVTDAATVLAAADADGISVTVYNDGAATMFVGGAAVTSSGAKKGVPVAAGSSFSMDLDPGERVYGVVAAGTTSALVLVSRVTA